jgi:tetratricopeptide (TPR) repeat protein
MLVLVVVSVGGGRLKAKAAPTGHTAGAEAVDQTGDTAGLRPSAKFALMVLALAMTFGYVRWVLVPVMRERALIMAAYQTDDLFERDEALRAAGEANPLAWEPAMFRGGSWQSAAASGRVPSPFIAFDRAAEAYTEALARQPRLRQAWLARADCLAPEGATPDPAVIQQAVDNLENAARLYPTSVTTHLRLAKMLERLGDRRQALEEYRRTLELDDLLPPEFRRLDDPQRQAAEAAARQLEESLAAPPAGP